MYVLFEGMNAFWKTLLQFPFPMYVIILVILIITISEYSTKFAWFLTKKNLVATLATLILLSCIKFLNTIIASFSYSIPVALRLIEKCGVLMLQLNI